MHQTESSDLRTKVSDALGGSCGVAWAGCSTRLGDRYLCSSPGETPLDLGDDCSLALVWRNNERLQEFVLVASKELECAEDPGSAGEAARAGHFTLDQCLNLFTRPEVLAPEEAW